MELFNKKKIVTNAFGMAAATLAQAVIRFFSIPLLLSIYGKDDFGLLALAMSVNAYLQLLALGVPGSLVKFVSASGHNRSELTSVCRSANSFFWVVGVISFLALAFFSVCGTALFGFGRGETAVLEKLFIVAAVSSFIYWPGAYLDSLMTAREDLVRLSSFRTLKALFELGGILLLRQGVLHWNLLQFFIFQLVCMHMFLPVKAWRVFRLGYPPAVFVPGWRWSVFKPVICFSSILIVIQVVTASLDQVRPVLLCVFQKSPGVAGDYRILFTIVNFALLGAGFLRTSILPPISRAYARGHHQEADELVQKASRYGWALLALPLFIGISLAPELLRLYVGEEYVHLSFALRVWLLAVSVQLYNGPSYAAVMGGGDLRRFALSVVVSGALSLTSLWLLAPRLGILAASCSTVVLNGAHLVFLHTLILRSVPGLQVGRLFVRSFLPPILVGCGVFYAGEIVSNLISCGLWGRICAKSVFVGSVYCLAMVLFMPEVFRSLVLKRRQDRVCEAVDEA